MGIAKMTDGPLTWQELGKTWQPANQVSPPPKENLVGKQKAIQVSPQPEAGNAILAAKLAVKRETPAVASPPTAPEPAHAP
jgi:hypothetical protein